MKYKLPVILLLVASQFFLGGCSYQVKPGSVTAVEIRSEYDDKIKGHAKLNISNSFRGINKQVKPKSYVCSAHDYPVEVGQVMGQLSN